MAELHKNQWDVCMEPGCGERVVLEDLYGWTVYQNGIVCPRHGHHQTRAAIDYANHTPTPISVAKIHAGVQDAFMAGVLWEIARSSAADRARQEWDNVLIERLLNRVS